MLITDNVLCTKAHIKQGGAGEKTPNPGKTSPPRGKIILLPFVSSSFYALLVETVLFSLICSLPYISLSPSILLSMHDQF